MVESVKMAEATSVAGPSMRIVSRSSDRYARDSLSIKSNPVLGEGVFKMKNAPFPFLFDRMNIADHVMPS